jgi:hypothetical protein
VSRRAQRHRIQQRRPAAEAKAPQARKASERTGS